MPTILKRFTIGFLLTLAAISAGNLTAHAQLADGIVAVVGDEPVLKSDVDNQVMLYAYQNQLKPSSPGLWEQVFQAVINQKILLTKAKLDSIDVNADEIDGLVDQRVEYLKSRLRTDEAVIATFGKSLNLLKVDLRDEIKGQRMVEELQRKKFLGMTVSNEEVRKFYETYRDSLPAIPAEVEVAHIVIRPKIDSLSKNSALEKIKRIEAELKKGTDFADLARRYSEDPGSAKEGGDLGFVRRGEFVRRFEEASFALKEGGVSGIVETEFGYHIIKLLEKRGESIHTQHILIRFDKEKLNDQAAIDKLNEIREEILSGKSSFAAMARRYSDDERTAERGGDIVSPQTNQKRLPMDVLLPELRSIVETLKQGQISIPKKITIGEDYAYAIMWLKYRAEEHRMNLEQDYQRIQSMALQQSQSQRYAKWLEQLKKEIYWKVKI
ncbi:MAG: peptidylprolyl isomerase [Chlorobiales bacterium]|nr:peptidylprolyl isomerase [Chlorobiales bacterium]